MKFFDIVVKRDAPAAEKDMKMLSDAELLPVSGGIVESPPPVHDTLVRPEDTKGIRL